MKVKDFNNNDKEMDPPNITKIRDTITVQNKKCNVVLVLLLATYYMSFQFCFLIEGTGVHVFGASNQKEHDK